MATAKAATVWTICKVGWEYDDCFYSRSGEGDPGAPVKAYRDKAKAQTECDRMNGEWLRTAGKGMRTEDDGDCVVGFELVEVEVSE